MLHSPCEHGKKMKRKTRFTTSASFTVMEETTKYVSDEGKTSASVRNDLSSHKLVQVLNSEGDVVLFKSMRQFVRIYIVIHFVSMKHEILSNVSQVKEEYIVPSLTDLYSRLYYVYRSCVRWIPLIDGSSSVFERRKRCCGDTEADCEANSCKIPSKIKRHRNMAGGMNKQTF